jgi:DNA invertase Pin-like site-specific DNA recombinase
MTSKALRIASYHRCSTIDQNPALAREELRAAAGRMGELVLEEEEKGSGGKNDRPGLQRVLAAARRGEFDVLVCWKLDRFGRSTVDLLANVQQLHTAGVRFVATTQGLDLRPDGDAVSRLLLTMLAGVAEFERELTRERVTLGMRKAKAAGKHVGRPTVTTDAEAAQAKRLRAQGASWAQVAAKLACTVASARRAAAR